eukprot:GSMAST32.ASY1.ANO1.1908.1 assembled CDS
MWAIVSFFNPMITFLALCTIKLTAIPKNSGTLLAIMGEVATSETIIISDVWLKLLVSIDAFIVLSGSVLTAYVGVGGLIRKLSQDRCLPQFFLKTNSWRGTNHYIIFGYFVYDILTGISHKINLENLSGVYCFAFLGLMICFTIGTMLLKYKRPGLPRQVEASWFTVVVALISAAMGVVGNLISKGAALQYFLMYTAAVALIMMIMFQRTFLLKMYLRGSYKLFRHFKSFRQRWDITAKQMMAEIADKKVVFFLKNDSLVILNKAILYVRENEETAKMLVVHVYDPEVGVPKNLYEHVQLLDSIYPKIQVSCICMSGTFSPSSVQWIARELGVSMNMMFITCPDSNFRHKVSELGMRVITTIPALDKVDLDDGESIEEIRSPGSDKALHSTPSTSRDITQRALSM